MSDLKKAGTFATPRLLGRLMRLVLAGVVYQLLVWPYIDLWQGYTRVREGWEPPGGTWWFPILLMIYLMPHMVDAGLGFRLGWRSRAAYTALLVAAAAANWAVHGSLWGPVLGWFLIVTGLIVFGHLTISFLVQGLFATPG